MKLHLKFVEPILDYNENNIDITTAILVCEKEAEKFAKEFLSWTNTYKDFGIKTNDELIEMFKKEKGL